MADIDILVSNATDLANAINTANANTDPDNAYTIIFEFDIALTTGDLPAIQAAVTIDGAGRTLYGSDPVDIGAPSFRGFFVYSSGDPLGAGVVIQNLTITSAAANGGDGPSGGGGGAGMGGALFVNSGAVVTVIDVSIIDNVAVGGNGDDGFGGGGGGMGGDGWDGGGSIPTGGGGLGSGATGGSAGENGSPGIVTDAASGGDSDTRFGGADGGGGAGGESTADGFGGGGGGIGGGDGTAGLGGDGGFGGGGGAPNPGTGGAGGFGGGGGSGDTGADGGYGGGGAGGGTFPASGGFGGGDAVGGVGAQGGGGAGMGGAVFVMDGGILNIAGAFSVSGNTVAAGTGAGDGEAFGSGLFLQGGALSLNTLVFEPGSGETQTVSDDIFDEQGAIYTFGYNGSPADFEAGAWDIFKTGAGTLVLTGTTSIGGFLDICGCEPENVLRIDGGSVTALLGTDVEGGTLDLINGATLETGPLTVFGAMTLNGPGTSAMAGETTVISLDPTGASIEISGGAGLDTAGSADIFSSVAGPASASVAGTGSSWTIDGLLSIGVSGLGAGAAAAYDGGAIIAGGVVIDTLGAFILGQGGLAGTLTTAAIENNGAFVASFTDTATVSSVISGTGTLAKGSLGTLILTGASNGFLGATTVNGGVLQVDGSLTASSIAVNGGTLGGNGSTGGVTVNAGGIVSAGASAGKLTTGTLAFASASTIFRAELGGTSAGIGGYDQVVVNGAVILGGASLSVLLLGGFVPSVGNGFTIIANDGTDAVAGTFAGLAQGATFQAGGAWFTVSYAGGDGNDVVLTATSAPVPPGVTIIGTAGPDIVNATATVPGQPFPTGQGDDIFGLAGDDTLSGLGGDDAIRGAGGADTIFGDDGNDNLSGGARADAIHGGAGDDFITGGRGRDQLFGDAGNDVLRGGEGRDVLTGGDGTDTFVFTHPSQPDSVTDFAEGDVVALAKSAFPGVGPKGVLAESRFHIGGEALTPKQKILYDEDSGWLLYAKKGSQTTDPIAFAKIGKNLDGFDHTDILVM